MPFVLCHRRDVDRAYYLSYWPTEAQVARVQRRWKQLAKDSQRADPITFWDVFEPDSEDGRSRGPSWWQDPPWWSREPGGAQGYDDKPALLALAQEKFAALPACFYTRGRPIWWPKLNSVNIVDQAQEMLRYAAKGPRDEWDRPIGR
jgi:hypothetical protein